MADAWGGNWSVSWGTNWDSDTATVSDDEFRYGLLLVSQILESIPAVNVQANYAITALDRALAVAGQTVILRKSNSVIGQLSVTAHVRGFRPNEIVGTIKMTDKKVIFSPTGLNTYGMPTGGFIVIDGIPRAIQGTPELFKMADQVVRIEARVLG